MSDAFDWAHIPDLACINAADLIELVYDDRSPGEARVLLAREAPSPDEAFLKRGPDAWDMARVLRRDWLGEDMQALDQVYNEAQGSDLIEMAKRPVSQRVKLKRIEKAHLRDGLRQILLRALFAAGTPEVDLDRLDLDSTFVIVPTSGRRGDLFRHQDLAVRHLHARWRRDGLAMRGLLVMPTGSGKTRTAVAWLIDDVIASGRQVLWVTHSRELLRQTARAFIEDAPRLKRHGRDDLRIRLISGEHSRGTTVGADGHDVAIATVQTLARNHKHLKSWLARGEVVVVFDEAHHSPSVTWRRILTTARETSDAVLGLTATPVRGTDAGTRALINLYAGPGASMKEAIIHEAPIDELIEDGILARPVPRLIPTAFDFEAVMSSQDEAFLAKFSDLSEGLKKRIANATSRNNLIVSTYREGPERDGATYGRAIVFAVSVLHCETLLAAFLAAGVRADAMYFGRPRGTNDEALRAFRDGEIDVLINIEMLTEGVDVPDVEAVFLARPTASLPLFSQMVGRGLRGPAIGGTRLAYIVDFQDLWGRFAEWRLKFSALQVDGVVPEEDPASPTAEDLGAMFGPVINALGPQELLQLAVDYGAQVASMAEAQVVSRMGLVPIGTYGFELDVDDSEDGENESRSRVLMVFAHEEPGYQEIRGLVASGDLKRLEALEDWSIFFENLPGPPPPLDGLTDFRSYVMATRMLPEFVPFAVRDALDPEETARRIIGDDLRTPLADVIEGAVRSAKEHEAFIIKAWGSVSAYRDEVVACAQRIITGESRPIEEKRVPRPLRPEQASWRSGTGYWSVDDIARIRAEVLADDQLFPDGLTAPAGAIRWSNQYAGAFAWYMGEPEDIFVSSIFDNPKTDGDLLRYLVFHELLHHEQKVDNHDLGPRNHLTHGPRFREREQQYPTWQKWDEFMDTFAERHFSPADLLPQLGDEMILGGITRKTRTRRKQAPDRRGSPSTGNKG